jgi:pantothenate kinase type III
MDIGVAILIGLIVGACIGGGIIYTGLQLIANELKKQK